MKHLRKFNENVGKSININFDDLVYMCKYNANYFNKIDKIKCDKFLKDEIVTDDILKIYCEFELESWGDMIDGLIKFIYNDTIITCKYDDNDDSPAKILSINKIKLKQNN